MALPPPDADTPSVNWLPPTRPRLCWLPGVTSRPTWDQLTTGFDWSNLIDQDYREGLTRLDGKDVPVYVDTEQEPFVTVEERGTLVLFPNDIRTGESLEFVPAHVKAISLDSTDGRTGRIRRGWVSFSYRAEPETMPIPEGEVA